VDLTLLGQDEVHVQLGCSGEVSQTYAKPGEDPLAGAAGPSVYARKVLLDCRLTRFIDSSGIGWLLLAHKRFAASGGRLILHSIPPLIRHPINLLRLDKVLTIVATEADALAVARGR
jgi:anti-anti-sigma factor